MVLVLGVLTVAVTIYLLASLSPVQDFVETTMHSTQNNGMTALDPVFYGVAGLAAFVLLLAIFRLVNSIIRKFNKPDPLGESPEKSFEEFAREAGQQKISVRVARESYELLSHSYPSRMCIDLDHDLRNDLKLNDDDIVQLYAGLLSRTERREMRSLIAENIGTVHDLLDYVEKAPAQHLDGVAIRVRATDLPSAERGRAVGPGIFLRDQASEGNRRASDYLGPRRRASDNKVKRAYSGPHRRATDRPQIPPAGAANERPAERPVEDSDKHALVLVPPRAKQPSN